MVYSSIWQLPHVPAVYVLFGGPRQALRAAFVGIAEDLARRVVEQLVLQERSTDRGAPGLAMQASFLNELRWWEHPDFADSNLLRAAEFVASDLFEPALRSRMPIGSQVAELVEDERLRERTRSLLLGEPSGCVLLPSEERLLERLSEFEGRLQALKERLEPGAR